MPLHGTYKDRFIYFMVHTGSLFRDLEMLEIVAMQHERAVGIPQVLTS